MFQVSPLADVRQVPGDGSWLCEIEEADLFNETHIPVSEMPDRLRVASAKAPHGFVMMASLRLSDALMRVAHRIEDLASKIAEFGWLRG